MEASIHNNKLAYIHHALCSNLDIISILILMVSIYLLYYFTHVVHKPVLHCSDYSPLKDRLLNNLTELEKDIYPLIWCYRPLIQTIIHTVFMTPIDIRFQREEIWTKDGGTFTLDFYGFHDDENDAGEPVTELESNKPIIVILPGATGHSEKIYVREFISCSMQSDYRAISFNFRGMTEGLKMKNSKLSCVTKGDDIDQILDLISQRYPMAPVMIVGFSIGACTIMNYLIRKGNNLHGNVMAATVVGTPWDPVESKYQLSTFWNNLVINKHMTNNLVNVIKQNYDVVDEHITDEHLPIDLKDLDKCYTVWDFDDYYICPMYGYKSHEELYKDASLALLPLENISIPVLCICSADDPLCREQAIPMEKILKNPLLSVVVTKYGGHLAWLEGILLTKKRFVHRLFTQYANMFFHKKKIL